MERNVIYSNSSASNGGGICTWDSRLIFNNNTIALNSCTSNHEWVHGGGIYAQYGSSLPNVIGYNNIVFYNYAIHDPEWYGNVNLAYSCVRLGMPGIGNIADDPQFFNPINLNFHLLENSPCIDTGAPNSPLDPDSTRADMGALYYDQSSGIYIHPAQETPSEFALLPNYPNPFNPKTRLTFTLPRVSQVRLVIFDITGRQVDMITENWLPAGIYHTIWDAGGLPSGMYFAKLTAGDFHQVQKLLLIK